jgi:hypothetical protein
MGIWMRLMFQSLFRMTRIFLNPILKEVQIYGNYSVGMLALFLKASILFFRRNLEYSVLDYNTLCLF